MSISEKIFKIMEEKNISQSELAKEIETSQSTVCDWKRKGTDPQAKKIMAICKALDCTPYDILED